MLKTPDDPFRYPFIPALSRRSRSCPPVGKAPAPRSGYRTKWELRSLGSLYAFPCTPSSSIPTAGHLPEVHRKRRCRSPPEVEITKSRGLNKNAFDGTVCRKKTSQSALIISKKETQRATDRQEAKTRNTTRTIAAGVPAECCWWVLMQGTNQRRA